MEKTLISWNVPNLVTINLMAWLGFLALTLLMQGLRKRRPAVANNGSSVVADLEY